MTVYFNGNFVDKDDVSISPDDRGFVFADGIYEVLRAENGAFFQEDLHFERMARSLNEIDLTSVDVAAVREAIHSLLYHNDLQDRLAKIYIQVTRGAAPRQHAVPTPPPDPTVYATVAPHTPPLDKWEQGVKAILHPDQRWARCDIKSISLLPNVRATTAARRADAYEAILVRDGFVTEASHSTVVGVFDDTVVTHPLTNHILPSTTRALLLDLCGAHDIPVEEIPIPEADLPDADELMVLGTTTGVMPVVQVDDWTVADGTPGPITRDLQAAFRALEPA
ncbi:MAG: aminotransferase [Bacteroidetes bacterium SW_9_63_38]|nr:MAG: aminotransferase [Bacteroidetes bacterium SW_9_63_38]